MGNHFVKNNSLLVLCISSIEFASPSVFSLPASFPCSLQSSTSFNMFRSQLLRQTARAVRASAINYPIERVRKLWGVNVDGTYLFAIVVAKHLMERKAPGSMVFIGSMSGAIVNVPQPQAPYNAAKAAVRHLASSLAVEWAHANIRVNCISPGYMLTALTKKILDDNPDLKKQWTSLIPQGKMGQPEDLMGAVTFLSSDASACHRCRPTCRWRIHHHVNIARVRVGVSVDVDVVFEFEWSI